ncbi:MAG: DNA polymerase ligase N-terminal domain-containing protein [Planctomycetota bacterium]
MPRFVVQEHHATRLHWDFRLEMDGVLKSWAVPKGPPEEGGVKRLAVEVDDHPLNYIDFQGVIEEGYGAGTVEIWDSGTYDVIKREDKVLVIDIHGRRMQGRHKLIFTGYGGGKGWLLIKGKSEVERAPKTIPARERAREAAARKKAAAKPKARKPKAKRPKAKKSKSPKKKAPRGKARKKRKT